MSFDTSTITAVKTLPKDFTTDFDQFLARSADFKRTQKDKKKRKRQPDDQDDDNSDDEAILTAINALKVKIKSWKDKPSSWSKLIAQAYPGMLTNDNNNNNNNKKVKLEVEQGEEAVKLAPRVFDPEVQYLLDNELYYERHVKGTAWTLPLLIEMTCPRHPHMPGVRILAILWYADPYVKEATNEAQSLGDFEAFHWRKDVNGCDKVHELASRSAYFHQIVHVESIAGKDNPVASAGHPAMSLIGRFFSSFHTVPGRFKMSNPGWDTWTIRGTGRTMGSIVLGRKGRGFVNSKQLLAPLHYPGWFVDPTCVSLNAQPRIPPRDLMVFLCSEECHTSHCHIASHQWRQEWIDAYHSTPPRRRCCHGYYREALCLVPEEGSPITQKQMYLDAQLTEIGKLLGYDDVKVREKDIWKLFGLGPLWLQPLFTIFTELQHLKFPQSIPLRQSMSPVASIRCVARECGSYA